MAQVGGEGHIFTGHNASAQQFKTITPFQGQVKGAAGNQAMQYLQQLGGGKFGQSPLALQALRNFETQTVPGLAERFTSHFGSGSQRGSGFQGALGQAGGELQGGLAALEQQFASQILPQLFQSSLSPEFENAITQGDTGIVGQILPFLANIIAAYFGGPGGAAAAAGNIASGGGQTPQPKTTISKQPQPSFTGVGQPQPFNIPNYNALIGNITQPRF